MNGSSGFLNSEADTFPAKLAISIARKMGALIFLVPEGKAYLCVYRLRADKLRHWRCAATTGKRVQSSLKRS